MLATLAVQAPPNVLDVKIAVVDIVMMIMHFVRTHKHVLEEVVPALQAAVHQIQIVRDVKAVTFQLELVMMTIIGVQRGKLALAALVLVADRAVLLVLVLVVEILVLVLLRVVHGDIMAAHH